MPSRNFGTTPPAKAPPSIRHCPPIPMASNYTCRACSRALARPSSLLPQTSRNPRGTPVRNSPRSSRGLSTSAPSLYYATKPLRAEAPAQGKTAVSKSVPKALPKSPLTGFAAGLRKRAPLMTETYVAYGATQQLFKECARNGDYVIPQALEKNGEIPQDEDGTHIGVGKGWWYDTLGLTPTFNAWAQITFIHMYMLQVRLRMFPATHAPIWAQHLTNQCFYAAEDRLVVYHKFTSTMLRQKQLKDLFSQWRGAILAYDEGLVKGDAMLAAAVWRNLFAGKEDVDFQKLAEIVGYMRREIRKLDLTSDEDIAKGNWMFGEDPGAEAAGVMLQSKLMKEGDSS
ncbi:ubiquinol-cytochrome C chaperone-domain-containing protein [Clohesyomyces aquaticus]|uniref:Ubiquinol-cytochrome C chaperone-domain-containing protein n=1 Tax=Clohesyomyces aquaticus TaxID=1231657 RepID=A0A1Y1YER0_9PLEO|nr:ubiquinol-cytochrome C chaperone-domain-containing protein [Clohesyomyces aquaticus]